MNNRISIPVQYRFLLLLLLVMLTIIACSSSGAEGVSPAITVVSNTPASSSESETDTKPPISDDGYPSIIEEAVQVATGYPGQATPDNISAQPLNPERELEPSSPELGAVGGVLIREIVETGFIPVIPRDLYLGKILTDSKGQQALIARGENAHKAELFSTGVFAFNGVQPGTYGLVIDLGFTEFPLLNEDGSEILIIVEAGKTLDLGQIFVDVPAP